MFGRKKLKLEIERLNTIIEVYQQELKDQRGIPFRSSYRFTESDFRRHGNNQLGMEKEAKQRMACALGRRIVKFLDADEIVEDGKLSGFKIQVFVRKVSDD